MVYSDYTMSLDLDTCERGVRTYVCHLNIPVPDKSTHSTQTRTQTYIFTNTCTAGRQALITKQ